jgi:hypothetical protein
MPCHICQAEAVTRCYNCGELVCAEHGKGDICPTCSGTFKAGDPRSDRISATPSTQPQHHGWWRPQVAEEYKPPECYECGGLSRGVCRNCQIRYCPEHAGFNGLCKGCARSANLGLYMVGGIGAMFLLLYLFLWLFG